MASDKPKLEDLQDSETAAAQADEVAAIDEAANAPQESTVREGIGKARDAELKRQADVEKAVAKAHKSELPKLGGDLLEPGLGR